MSHLGPRSLLEQCEICESHPQIATYGVPERPLMACLACPPGQIWFDATADVWICHPEEFPGLR